jgi:phosphomannomutase
MVRVMVEAADQATADRLAQQIADVVKAELAL